jgi:hypothetical protein
MNVPWALKGHRDNCAFAKTLKANQLLSSNVQVTRNVDMNNFQHKIVSPFVIVEVHFPCMHGRYKSE